MLQSFGLDIGPGPKKLELKKLNNFLKESLKYNTKTEFQLEDHDSDVLILELTLLLIW